MRKLNKKQNGITLIALIVTIIVLIVLAGVSINLVAGSDGILKKATTAVDKNATANAEEEINLALDALKVEYYKDLYTTQSLKEYLLEKCSNFPTESGQITSNDSQLIYSDKNGNKSYIELSDDGDIISIRHSNSSASNDTLNVIFMIGDGMGQNHIKSGEINKGSKLYMQTIPNRTEVTTYSYSVSNDGAAATDSAASATALATGIKTKNYYVGKDPNQNNVQNLTEYSKSLGLKTGTVSTQTIYHATPAGFTAHTSNRSDYPLIARRQVTEENVDLMIGGGQQYFSGTQDLRQQMIENGYNYITNFSDLSNYGKDQKVIGAFSWDRMTKDSSGNAINANPTLAQMTEAALSRLENNQGFFVMIEGSDIDTYSHKGQMANMLNELQCFDNAIKVAMNYVDSHPNTLLIVTADHETGGLSLNNVTSKNQLTDSLFTNRGSYEYDHTNQNVFVYTYGKYAEELTNHGTIDNTDIHHFVKEKLQKTYQK